MSLLSPAAKYFGENTNGSFLPMGVVKSLLTEVDAIPTPWNTGQASPITAGNAKFSYGLKADSPETTSENAIRYGFLLNYNDVPVVYIPKEFVDKGLYTKDRVQYYDDLFLNKDIYNYLKPATVDPKVFSSDQYGNDSFLKNNFSDPYSGYIIDFNTYGRYQDAASINRVPTYSFDVSGSSKDNAPIQGISEKDGVSET